MQSDRLAWIAALGNFKVGWISNEKSPVSVTRCSRLLNLVISSSASVHQDPIALKGEAFICKHSDNDERVKPGIGTIFLLDVPPHYTRAISLKPAILNSCVSPCMNLCKYTSPTSSKVSLSGTDLRI